MKKINFLIIASLLLLPSISLASGSLPKKLSGRFLLQVQSAGQAWYVNPADGQRYYLGRPTDAFYIMRQLGLGISEADFNKLKLDRNLKDRVKGKIILRVQSKGEAYYINPTNWQTYYLGRPGDAFNLIHQLGLGISEQDIIKISIGYKPGLLDYLKPRLPEQPPLPPETVPADPAKQSLDNAAAAIRNNDAVKTESYFTASMSKAVEYTMKVLNADSRLLLANILSGAKLESQTDSQKTYSAQAYFSLGGYNVPLYFNVKKQPDGSWLFASL